MHELRVEQIIPRPLEEVFPFFETPENLEAITPPLLHFRIVTPRPIRMTKDAIIDYRLKIRGVPVRWRTRILDYNPPLRFVDSQIKGPYRVWIHEHVFERIPAERGGGTLMRDIVRYELPLAPLSSVVHRWLVRPDLEKIFAYRREAVERLLVGAAGAVTGSRRSTG